MATGLYGFRLELAGMEMSAYRYQGLEINFTKHNSRGHSTMNKNP